MRLRWHFSTPQNGQNKMENKYFLLENGKNAEIT